MSEEQTAIVEACATSNVRVDAVAGSGKSTTTRLVAKAYPDQAVLCLTYSASLKASGRLDAPPNLTVHSFHSACLALYGRGTTDYEMLKVVDSDLPPGKPLPVYGIIVVDEAQDMTPLLFRFVRKLYRDMRSPACRLAIVGDQMQTIFQYQGADPRFLTCAEECFAWNELPWRSLALSTSFRVPAECTAFLNRCLLGQDRVRSSRGSDSGQRTRYRVVRNMFDPEELFSEVQHYLQRGFGFGDIFVLAQSLKGGKGWKQTPVQKLTNLMSRRNVPVIVDEELRPECTAGKVAISTVHKAKGMERPVVILLGADQFMAKREPNPAVCPNSVYVACTRASQCLSLMQAGKEGPLPCLRVPELHLHAEHVGGAVKVPPQSSSTRQARNRKYTARELTKHLQCQQVVDIVSRFEAGLETAPPRQRLNLSDVSLAGGESVAALNGLVLALEYCGVENVLHEATRLYSADTGYYHKFRQLDRIDWMKGEERSGSGQRLAALGLRPEREHFFQERSTPDGVVSGVVDYADDDSAYKIVTAPKITNDDIVDLAALVVLCPGRRRYGIYSVESDAKVTLERPDPRVMGRVVADLVRMRGAGGVPMQSDSEFVYEHCQRA